MGESDWHRHVMFDLLHALDHWFAAKPLVYVSGNLLVYFVPGDKRQRVSPDVFVVFGVPKRNRPYFLAWEERKSPTVVIEVTSKKTMQEDLQKKWTIYRDVLKVKEYIVFDPRGEFLKPRLQGYRLRKGAYVPIEMVDGRLPSKVLDLHFEADRTNLRLFDPATNTWLLTPEQRVVDAEDRISVAERRIARAQQKIVRHRQEVKKHRRLDPKSAIINQKS